MENLFPKWITICPNYPTLLQEFNNLLDEVEKDPTIFRKNSVDDYERDPRKCVQYTTFLNTVKPEDPQEYFKFLILLNLENEIYFDRMEDYVTDTFINFRPDKHKPTPLKFIELIKVYDRLGLSYDVKEDLYTTIWNIFSVYFNDCEIFYTINKIRTSDKDKGFALKTLSNYLNHIGSDIVDLNDFKKYQTIEEHLKMVDLTFKKKLPFMVEGLWEKDEEYPHQQIWLKLTEKGIRLILPKYVDQKKKDLEQKKQDERDKQPNPWKTKKFEEREGPYTVLEWEEIPEVDLIYEEYHQKFYDRITTALGKFDKQNLPKNYLSILLSGKPGTGKTEAARQWARHHQADVMIVENSQIQAKYVGDDLKALNKVFDDYNYRIKHKKTFLLFDECNGLFGLPGDINVTHSSGYHAQALGVELLRLMDPNNCKGVILLSCNHTNNFNEAMHRRITFTHEFTKPNFDKNTRKKQWLTIEGPWVQDVDLLHKVIDFTISPALIRAVLHKYDILHNPDDPFDNNLLLELLTDEEKQFTKDKKFNGKEVGFKLAG